MRTDPRADEVRGIVERVFSGYSRKKRERRGTAAYEGIRSRKPVVLTGVRSHDNRLAGSFPRLFAPEEADCGQAPLEIDEKILIDQGQYVARSYRIEGYLAMWLVPVGLLQFYDDRGEMLATIDLFQSLRPQRMAA
jgi:hypothetical protein